MLANFLATTLVDRVFSLPELHNGKEILFAIYGYAVQIYCDFSGYTDIAIGLALLLGFRFPQNFNAPVHRRVAAGLLAPLAHDVVALAARLPLHPTRWQPTGRAGDLPQPHDHDAARRPVARGGMDLRRVGRDSRRRAVVRALPAARARSARASNRRPTPCGVASAGACVTFHIVCLAWVFFRAETFHTAWVVLTRLFVGWGSPTPLITGGVVLAIAVGIGMQYIPSNVIDRAQVVFSRLSPVQMGIAMAVALALHRRARASGCRAVHLLRVLMRLKLP